jgi:hypothetical protein
MRISLKAVATTLVLGAGALTLGACAADPYYDGYNGYGSSYAYAPTYSAPTYRYSAPRYTPPPPRYTPPRRDDRRDRDRRDRDRRDRDRDHDGRS